MPSAPPARNPSLQPLDRIAHFNKPVVEPSMCELSGGASVLAVVSDEVRGSASGGAEVIVMGDALLNVQASGGASVDRF